MSPRFQILPDCCGGTNADQGGVAFGRRRVSALACTVGSANCNAEGFGALTATWIPGSFFDSVPLAGQDEPRDDAASILVVKPFLPSDSFSWGGCTRIGKFVFPMGLLSWATSR
jgi:hypothetical protein